MSSLFDSLSEELFEVLKGSGKTLTLYGEDGNKTYEPKKARRVFATPDNIMVSVVEAGSDSEVKLYLSQSTDIRGISKLINTLRQIATRYNVLFNVRKYGRELQPKDFAYQASMMEAAMWGTTHTSYQKFGPTKLIIRHYQPVREGVIGARGRNILSMFVETQEGERFKFAENHLSAGRAFAQHINQGGKPHDEVGTQLVILAQESLALARVNRYIHHARNILGEEAVALRIPIRTRIVELRRAFLGMSRPRGYHKVKEAGLPATATNLNEASSDRLGHLHTLLQIDSNHALAESLMPVALLPMGENMTDKNTMFRGVLTLEDTAADALVEALLDEYGYGEDSWTRFGSNIAFNEDAIFEDAQEVLDLIEATYQINENDAILDYATQWTNHRLGQSGRVDFQDPKDRKEHDKGIDDLANGLRAILSGHIEMPNYPFNNEPRFRDESAAIRYFLDLYVSQNKLGNIATANYVSTIIDKMAEGKKLDGAEKTIANKLYSALEDHVDANRPEGEMDESFPYDDRDDAKYEAALEHIVDTFDYDDFINDVLPFVKYDEEKDEPLETKYIMDNLDGYIAMFMDNMGFNAQKGDFKHEADELFKVLKQDLEKRGYHFDTTIQEFAEMEDKPEHHGFAAGDHVATDKGPATVISVEGDLATVEFLHGGTDVIDVVDMDKIPELATFGEEADLAQWFEGFDPENILEAPLGWSLDQDLSRVKAEPTNPDFDPEIKVGDRVTHKAYGSGEVKAVDDKNAKVLFDNPHVRLPDNKTVTMNKGILTKAGAYRKAAEEVEVVEAATSDNSIDSYINTDLEDDVEVTVEFDVESDDPSVGYRGGIVINSVVRKDNGEDVYDLLSAADLARFQEEATEELQGRIDDRGDYEYDRRRDSRFEDVEVIGGDQGQDLIDDVKVKHGDDEVDEAFRAELESLLKNARFRM